MRTCTTSRDVTLLSAHNASTRTPDPLGRLPQDGRTSAARGEVAECGGASSRAVEVLGSRVLLRPSNLAGSRRFYRDILGLAVYREFGDPADPCVVFFLGGGFLEISGAAAERATPNLSLWLQVRDVAAEHRRLQGLGVDIVEAPCRQPWGLTEMWLADPDGVGIVLVEVPEEHPLRRDLRSLTPAE
jgi:catechol 2,3-dioxygenase-like lactoylglutathione lyase family enzyme